MGCVVDQRRHDVVHQLTAFRFTALHTSAANLVGDPFSYHQRWGVEIPARSRGITEASTTQAARVVNAVRDDDVYIEQPCFNYEECLATRRRTPLPFVLDENIDGMSILQRAIADNAMDAINLKISKVGGLTKAHAMRDLCIANGITMTIEDTWGGDTATAAIAHLARSTPEDFLLSATDFNSYVTKSIVNGAPKRVDSKMTAADRPGLGIDPICLMALRPNKLVRTRYAAIGSGKRVMRALPGSRTA